MSDSLVRVSKRVEWGATGQHPERADAEARRRRALPATIEETALHERTESPGFVCPSIHAGPCAGSIGVPAHRHSTYNRGASPAPIRFPPDNFKHSLTLFSKSFSSFPRGTCSLTGPGMMGLSPSPTPPSRGLGPGPPLRTLLQTTIWTTEPPDSKAGLFPIRSPLLRESLRSTGPPDARRGRGAGGRLSVRAFLGAFRAGVHLRKPCYDFSSLSIQVFLGAFRAGVRWSPAGALARDGGGARAKSRSTSPARTPQLLNTFAWSFCCADFDNDPSAGSPTETLLRLLLPLNDKVQWTSRNVAGS
ncbi:hypothetical protein CQW23_35478 [Capsicum baccatum]|uniref:Protein TAR1 n=1 Tax=Capsicum baccatum TaxID=33114 RepID=A0A2G2UVW0_CAPBA|nr:hypothetical protein CQW23_35478 [Capsicum baccatum]